MIGNIPYIAREQTDKIFTSFTKAIENPRTNSLVFNVWGIGGVGKTRLLNELQKQPKISFARVFFGSTQDIATPLKLMANLYNQLPAIQTIDDWGEESETFTELYQKYEQTLRQLEQPDPTESDVETTKRKEAIKKIVAGSAKTLVKFIPGVKEISGAEDKIGLIAEEGVDLVGWLQKQKATKRDKELQALMLKPIPKLTEAFIRGLIAKSKQQAVVLLLDTYEKANSEIDDWLWQYLIANSQLQSHSIRIVVAGRNNLLKRESWRKLQQDFNSVYSLEIERFNLEQTQAYLKNIEISESEEIYRVTKGLPYYLNWIREQKEKGKQLDFSQGNQEITLLLLQELDSKQQRIIQLAACCRWFDRALIEDLITNPKLDLVDVIEAKFDCFEWLKQLDFVELSQHSYRLDDVARDVFRLALWQDNTEQFCQVHLVLAGYFEQKANAEVPADSSPRLQYENAEWREYTAEFLYHYLFAKQQDSEQKFLSHLFESCYFEQTEIVSIPFDAITAEADLENYQLLSTSIQKFLKTIQPICEFGYLAFDEQKLVEISNEYANQYFSVDQILDEQLEKSIREPEFRKSISQSVDEVKRKIKPALNYCFERLESLNGLPKFTALLYKAKNCPQSQQLTYLRRATSQAETIIIEADPQFSSGLFLWNIGNLLFEFKHYKEAITSFDRALKINPESESAWGDRGLALANLERYEEAVASYDRILEINPKSKSAWSNRGVSLRRLERYEEAVASYDRALEINPDDDFAWMARGYALDYLNRYEEAVTSYDRALAINPDSYFAWYFRGDALDYLKKYEEAVASYDHAIEINPDDDFAWIARGDALDYLKKYEEAVASYDRALEINPDDDSAWYNRGLALANLERYEEAVASYDRALEINPDDDSAWYNLACCFALQNQIESVLENLTKAITLNPECREMAKTDADFDKIRNNPRFQELIE